MLDPRYNPPYRLPKNPRDWIDPRRIEMQLNHQRLLEQTKNTVNDPRSWEDPRLKEMRLNHQRTVEQNKNNPNNPMNWRNPRLPQLNQDQHTLQNQGMLPALNQQHSFIQTLEQIEQALSSKKKEFLFLENQIQQLEENWYRSNDPHEKAFLENQILKLYQQSEQIQLQQNRGAIFGGGVGVGGVGPALPPPPRGEHPEQEEALSVLEEDFEVKKERKEYRDELIESRWLLIEEAMSYHVYFYITPENVGTAYINLLNMSSVGRATILIGNINTYTETIEGIDDFFRTNWNNAQNVLNEVTAFLLRYYGIMAIFQTPNDLSRRMSDLMLTLAKEYRPMKNYPQFSVETPFFR